MTEEKPLVTAVVTTHNRISLLPRALDSVAAQTYPNMELVVVDDGSDEDVGQVVKSYHAAIPISFIKNEKALGSCRARNQGMETAKGVFVAGLDDDDEWHLRRIEKLVGAYSDEYSFVTSDVRMMYRKGTPVWHKKEIISLDDLLYSNYVGNQGLVKRERLLEIGGFDESLDAAQDYDLWIRLAEKYGSVKNVQEPLQNIFLEHGGKRISNPADQLRGYLKFYNKHKSKMNYSQRKYQLYNIRKATGKISELSDVIGWVPPHRYWKEVKGWIIEKFIAAKNNGR